MNWPVWKGIDHIYSERSVWQWFDWSDLTYKKFTELSVGEQRVLPGPFDPVL